MNLNNIQKRFGAETRINWYAAVWLTLVHFIAFASLFFFTWKAFFVFFVLYVATAFGITFGFHRLFTHRSFKANKPVEYGAAFLGTLAMQGNIKSWVAHHRMHHAHSDTGKDPHDANEGFWHSHMGWMFMKRPEMDDPEKMSRFSRDIVRDPVLRFLGTDLNALLIQLFFALFLLCFGVDVMLWGIFVRLVFVYHVTWFVNSACHIWGYKNYVPEKPNLATNCWWVGLLALGEGWHNNHHAMQECAYAGHKWWEFDFTGNVIRALKKLGWVWDVKGIPTAAQTLKIKPPARSPMPSPIPAEVI